MKNYPTKKLGEVCKVKKGKKPELFGVQTKTRFPYLEAKFLRGTKEAKFAEMSDKNSVSVSKDDLIIICDGSKSGDVFSGFEGVLSSTMSRIDFDKKQVEKMYLELFLKTKFDLFNSSKKGAAIPHLDFNIFNNLEIPLPSIAEQKKIVARLEGLLGKIKEAKRLRAEAQEAAQNLLPAELHRIFSQPIRQTQGKQHSNILQNVGMSSKSAFVPPTLSASEGRSKNYGAAQWEEKELGEISDVITGNTPKTSISSYYGNEYLWARPGDLNEAYVGSTEKMLSKEGFEKSGVRKILAGAVMMCCIGSIGKIGIASQEMATNQQINAFVPHTKKLDGKFLFYSLIRSREKFISGASSTTLQIINKSRCEAIKIPLPPLAEQKKIVARLDSLSEKIKSLRQAQAKTASDFISLEQSILSKSFSG
ncbi:MAG: hypothetical protein A3A32_00640 [Candidatus Wildermuthbacteria bacterium RIFCSPLOWO2_01_FULL_48_35]|uniref:Type I restriction modification DNA specificity domain-containing protein n=2 Tax=Candidatus Wildermuthiibacteriota TaxID=1817923 RepID=A0A1G2RR96_9BACT|nr:MAG: hypothetical protein A3D59_03370 [Candidatus Wildermuthbacteria bacterium RIFCSPHIGHO2_02_FULL_47_17]OHA74551.1 MAG: hypothetical protein A3A32_00640 [Candidatus Wildermuthbacteria bacterium RIFCSPLOWO2_01_FULL_48_35]